MWDEYELTPHAASELRNDAYDDLPSLKKLIAGIKDEIRRLGDVYAFVSSSIFAPVITSFA